MDMVNLCYISFQVPNRDNYREKGNSDVFLLNIDRGIEEILKIELRNIAIRTDYGELTLYMLPGSKSRHL